MKYNSNQIVEEDTEYESIDIGTQVWMTRNLDVDYFRNGDKIPEVRDRREWLEHNIQGLPAWCFYNNDSANGKIYGKLYNWNAVNDPRGLAPEGWHIPSDEEWSVLSNFLGGEDVAGGKLKTTDFWESPNGGADNSSGFTGLPGGSRYGTASGDHYGDFNLIGMLGSWWCSTEMNAKYAWKFHLHNHYGRLSRSYVLKKNGFSVRCLRDIASKRQVVTEPTVSIEESELKKNIERVKKLLCYRYNFENPEKKYSSIGIGCQMWMQRNLDVSYFRNGDLIPQVREKEEWKRHGVEGKPAWCFYNNDSANVKIYGKLYNWFAVNDPRGLAPEGWHIPSEEEWNILILGLGGKREAGGRIKSTEYWDKPNAGANNSSGFTGLPGGYRSNDGEFYSIRQVGYLWSCTKIRIRNADSAYFVKPYNSNSWLSIKILEYSCGLSVRCLRD